MSEFEGIVLEGMKKKLGRRPFSIKSRIENIVKGVRTDNVNVDESETGNR